MGDRNMKRQRSKRSERYRARDTRSAVTASVNSPRLRGEKNSSITRVRPVFQSLLDRDSTGRTWLPALLRLASRNPDRAEAMAVDCGTLIPELQRPRRFRDKIFAQ